MSELSSTVGHPAGVGELLGGGMRKTFPIPQHWNRWVWSPLDVIVNGPLQKINVEMYMILGC